MVFSHEKWCFRTFFVHVITVHIIHVFVYFTISSMLVHSFREYIYKICFDAVDHFLVIRSACFEAV